MSSPDNDTVPREGESRRGEVRSIRELTSTLSTMRAQSEGGRVLRASCSLIRCMMFFDLCYLITGISLITVGLSNNPANKERMIMLGGLFGVLASLSATCNSLASHGLRVWRRGFLVPWMLYYLVVLSILVLMLARSFYTEHINLRQVFLFLICLTLFSCWRHIQKQFLLMAYPRPEQVVVDVEAVVRDLFGGSEAVPEPGKDLPPKYEEVEDLPPVYDPATMVQDSSAAGVSGAAAAGQVNQSNK